MEINLKTICAINKYAASTKETRYYLNGVFLHTAGGYVYAVATDGHMMIVHRFPNVDGADFKFIIPRSFLSAFKFSARDTGAAQIFYEAGVIRVLHNGENRSVQEVDGTFPAYDRVRPVDGGETVPAVFSGRSLAGFDDFAKAIGTYAVVTPRGKDPALVTFGRSDTYGAVAPVPGFTEKRPFASRAPF